MPERTLPCPTCRQPATLSFGENGRGWYESFQCDTCGEAYESDNGPPLPEDYRQAILAEEGEWTLHVTVTPTTEVLKGLRAALGLSIAEASQLQSRLPGEIKRGTKHEVERLLNEIRQNGAGDGLEIGRVTV